MISIPAARLGFGLGALPIGDVELSDAAACALVADIVAKLQPAARGRLLASLDTMHRRAGEALRDG